MIRPLPEGAVNLRPLAAAAGEAGPVCELTVQGQVVRQSVPGAVLEAAFQSDGRTLVFLTDDLPFEDSLHVHLLDEGLALLDSAVLSAMYATGIFELIGSHSPRSVRFRFFGGWEWTVELLTAAAMRLPLVSEPRGVHRRLGFTRHFKVHGHPEPDR